MDHFAMMQQRLLIDFIVTIIIVLSSSIIFIKTRELYILTNHKGLKYFSNLFLFFAIHQFFRFVFHQFKFIFRELDHNTFFPITIGIIVFTISLIIINLLYSVLWRKFDKEPYNQAYFIYFLAFAITILFIYTNFKYLFLILELLIMIAAIIISYLQSKNKKKHAFSKAYFIYILIFLIWVVNLIGVFIPKFMHFQKGLFEIIGAILFLIILMFVLNKTKIKKN